MHDGDRLLGVVEALYHLQRGVLLGNIIRVGNTCADARHGCMLRVGFSMHLISVTGGRRYWCVSAQSPVVDPAAVAACVCQHDDDVAYQQGLLMRSDVYSSARIVHPVLLMASPPIVPSNRSPSMAESHSPPHLPASGPPSFGAVHALSSSSLPPLSSSSSTSAAVPPPPPVPSLFTLKVPLSTLALQSHVMLLLDHNTRLYLWSGAEVAGPGPCRVRVTKAQLCVLVLWYEPDRDAPHGATPSWWWLLCVYVCLFVGLFASLFALLV